MDLVSPTCYLAFLVTAVFGLGGKFYALKKLSSWEEANRYCTLATPRINYTRYGLSLDFGEDFDVGEYWVGYTTHNLIFQYIGCSLERDVAGLSKRNFNLPHPSPGVCYSACGARVFGIMATHCYCFGTRPNVDVGKPTCAWTCKQAGLTCGGESAVSIFKVSDLTMSAIAKAPNDTEYCIAYDPSNQAFIWKDCVLSSKAQRCQTSSGYELSTSGTSRMWSKSAEYCFSRRYTNDNSIVVDNTSLYWTAYFRTNYYIHTDRGIPVFYGYVNIYGDTKKLPEMKFGIDKSGLNAICIAKERPTTTPENGIEYLPVKIGVPLLISVCIAVVVAGVICYRRRSHMKHSTQAPDIVEYYSQVQDPYDDAQNVYNEPYEKVIERKSYTSEHARENRSMPNDEADYNTTGAGKSATKSRVGDNVYNTLELVTDDTYDHVNGRNDKRNTRADKPGSRKANTGYGIVAENTYDCVDTEEGSYSHVNAGIRQQKPTYIAPEQRVGDNVYNTLELVTDDTYDHVNGPNGKRGSLAVKPGSRNARAGYVVVAKNTYARVDIVDGAYSHVNADKRTPMTTDIAAKRKVGDNVYNTLELVTDDTYDHVNGRHDKRDIRADKPGSRNAKTGYGIGAESTYDRVDIEEGSYSHVKASIRKQVTTDNVYN